MALNKRIFSVLSIFFLFIGIFFSIPKVSLAQQACSSITWVDQNNQQQQGVCKTSASACISDGGAVNPAGTCNNQAVCCTNMQTTCTSQGGTCQLVGTCTGTTTTYYCPGGAANVCCTSASPTSPPGAPSPTPEAATKAPFVDDYNNNMDQGEGFNVKGVADAIDDYNLYKAISMFIGRDALKTDKDIAFVPGGLLGVTVNAISYAYTPPASGIQYLAQLKDNFLGKPAYAQGTGFAGLQALLPIWRGFRNTTYILFSLVFIALGIMIMLRVKISPQAIITIQSAIPQFITALILVTFSYAIAGLLIDISYFIQNLALAVLFQTQAGGLRGALLDRSFTDFANGGFGMLAQMMWRAFPVSSALLNIATPFTAIIGTIVGGAGVLGPGGAIAALAGFAIGFALFFLIILIFLAIWLITFFFGIVKCYVMIIFKIILAPLEIGLGAIPSLKIGFTTWIIDLIAYLAVFPVSYLFMIIANIIIDKTTNASLWIPNLLTSNPSGPITTVASVSESLGVHAANAADGFTDMSGGLVPVAIGLASMALLSKLPTLIPELISETIKKSVWGKALGDAYKSTWKTTSGITGGAGQYGANRVYGKYSTAVAAEAAGTGPGPSAQLSRAKSIIDFAAGLGIVRQPKT